MARQIVKDRDRGMARLIAQLRKGGRRVTVGIHADDADRDGDGGVSNVQLGTIHEFGTSHVPERSFIRATMDEDGPVIRAALAEAGRRSVRKGANHAALLEAFGAFVVGRIKRRIRNHIAPPLADSTVDRKGSSTPLIDTGQLIGAIKAKVS